MYVYKIWIYAIYIEDREIWWKISNIGRNSYYTFLEYLRKFNLNVYRGNFNALEWTFFYKNFSIN